MPSNPLTKEQERKTLIRIWQNHFDAKQARDANFMPQYQAAMKIYMDQTITQEERQLIYERGQSDVTLNWLRILLRDMRSYMSANKPQWGAFGVRDIDSKAAKLNDAILGHIWRTSKGYLQIVDLIKKGVVGGLGLFSAYIDYRADRGLGEVKWRSIPIQYFYGDWRSQDQMFDDMAFQQIALTLTMNTARGIVPKDRHKELANLSTVPYDYDTLFKEGNVTYGEYPDPNELTRVRYIQDYRIEEKPVWELTDLSDPTGKSVFRLDENPDVPLPYAIDIKKLDLPTLVKYDCIYGMGEDHGIVFQVTKYPFDKFLIKPFINEFSENPFPVGEAYFLDRLQKYIDKSLRVALQHEQFAANPGVFVPKGSIDDLEKFERKVNFPGFVEEYDAEYGRPEFKHSQLSNSGFYNFFNLGLETMKAATGNQFTSKDATGSSLSDQQAIQAGQSHGDDLFRAFEATLEDAGEAALILAKHHYDYPKQLLFIDKRKRPATLQVNQSFENDDGELDGYYMKEVDRHVAIITKSYTPSNKFMNQRIIAEAMSRAPANVQDILFVELVKAMELDPEVIDEIEARTQILPQLMQQMEQAGQAIEELQTELKQKDDQIFSADRKVKRAEFDAQLEILLKSLKADLKTIANTAKIQKSAEIDKLKTNIASIEKEAKQETGANNNGQN